MVRWYCTRFLFWERSATLRLNDRREEQSKDKNETYVHVCVLFSH